MNNLEIGKFDESLHSHWVGALIRLLQPAYRPLAEKGLRYLATHQSPGPKGPVSPDTSWSGHRLTDPT